MIEIAIIFGMFCVAGLAVAGLDWWLGEDENV